MQKVAIGSKSLDIPQELSGKFWGMLLLEDIGFIIEAARES